MAQFDGQFLNEDVFQMAAALHISLVLNHPFVDGNKRTALMASVTFLGLNGYSIRRPHPVLVPLTRGVALGSFSKDEVATAFRIFVSGGAGPTTRSKQ
jgi:death on curing protein